MTERKLEDLLRDVVAGDRDAAEELARRYERRVRGVVSRRLGQDLRRRLDTEDILQSTIVTALKDLPGVTYKGEKAFLAWLSTVAERQLLMNARHHHAKKRDSRRERPIDAAWGLPGDRTSPTKGAVRNEVSEDLKSAIAQLPERERQVVELHSFGEMRFEDIADRLGLSGKSAAHRVFENALKRMGDILDSDEDPST